MNKNLTFVSITISILILLIFININNPSTTFIIFNSSSPILKEIDAKPIAIENIAGSDKTGKISCSVDGKKLNFAYKVQKGEKVTVDDQTCNVKAGGNIEFTDPEGNSKVLNNEQNLVKFFGISGGPSLTDKAAADKAAAGKAAAGKAAADKAAADKAAADKAAADKAAAAAGKTPQTPIPKPNNPPVVKLTNFPKVVKENTTVTLNAAATTDPEDKKNFLKFQWAQSAGVPIKKFLTKVDSPILRFVLPEVTPAGGSITMQLIVTDSKGESSISKSPIFISIQNINKPPISFYI